MAACGITATSRRAQRTPNPAAVLRNALVMVGRQKKAPSLDRRYLEAAVRCFVDHGYANTTTAMIADEANVSRGAMMHHFPLSLGRYDRGGRLLCMCRRLNEYRELMT